MDAENVTIRTPGAGPHVVTHKPGKRFKNAARGGRKRGESLKAFARRCGSPDAKTWLKAKGLG